SSLAENPPAAFRVGVGALICFRLARMAGRSQSWSYASRGLFRRLPAWVRAIIVVLLVFILLPYVLTPLYAVAPPVSTLMLWRWVTGQRVERIFVPISNISPSLVRAVIAAEDGRFCSHHGLDLKGIQEAIADA